MEKIKLNPLTKEDYLQKLAKSDFNIITSDTLNKLYNEYLLEYYGYKVS